MPEDWAAGCDLLGCDCGGAEHSWPSKETALAAVSRLPPQFSSHAKILTSRLNAWSGEYVLTLPSKLAVALGVKDSCHCSALVPGLRQALFETLIVGFTSYGKPLARVNVQPSPLTNFASLSYFYDKPPAGLPTVVNRWCAFVRRGCQSFLKGARVCMLTRGSEAPRFLVEFNLMDLCEIIGGSPTQFRVDGEKGPFKWRWVQAERLTPPPVLSALEAEALSTSELEARWEPSVSNLALRDTSPGFLPQPLRAASTSRRDMAASVLKAHGGDFRPIYLMMEKLYAYLFSRNVLLLLQVFGKPDDPLAFKKIVGDACHRTIVMPDVLMMFIEHRLTSWSCAGAILSSNVVSASNRFTLNPNEFSMGGACPAEIHHMLRSQPTGLSLDISKWDRSLPASVINAFYESWIPVEGRKIGAQHNGSGVFSCGGHLFRFNGVSAWSSGQLETLSGNSKIHTELLKSLGITEAMVMGDDCYIFPSQQFTEEQISNFYASSGLSVKVIDRVREFCKVLGDSEEVLNGADVAEKFLAKYLTTRVDWDYVQDFSPTPES